MAWISISISYNILITSAIASRLLLHRRRIREALGKSHASQYAGIAVTFVESAMLVTIPSAAFVALYASGSTWALVFPRFISQLSVSLPIPALVRGTRITSHVQLCAPMLIMVRANLGRNSRRLPRTANTGSRILFANHNTTISMDTPRRISAVQRTLDKREKRNTASDFNEGTENQARASSAHAKGTSADLQRVDYPRNNPRTLPSCHLEPFSPPIESEERVKSLIL
jgi:hypothetical protein